jgi:ribonucleoside-diphosphate reductase alpha chain
MNSKKIYTYEEALEASLEYFNNDDVAARVFVDKYALRNRDQELLEKTPTDMHWRIANELARIEKDKFKLPFTAVEIFSYLDHFRRIVFQGSPMYGIGNKYQYISLGNCFCVTPPVDSYGGIHFSDQQIIQISKRRGGCGIDLSELRPHGASTSNAAKTSTGIIPFVKRYNNSIREVGQHGRRGALLISLSVHHPEIVKFIQLKTNKTEVVGANLSVKLTEEFLQAVKNDKEYQQRWPVNSEKPIISNFVKARDVWNLIVNSAWACGDPGLLFWDYIIKESISDCYSIYGFNSVSTNPCGEQILPALDSCRLLSINLFGYVNCPFTCKSQFDFEALKKDAEISQRFMDDMVDLEIESIQKIINKIKNDPEDMRIKRNELEMWQEIKTKCEQGRRIGVGTTGLADALAALDLKYGSTESMKIVESIYKTIKLGCYRSSVDMAKELGPFPIWDKNLEKNNPYLLRLKEDDKFLWNEMQKYGRRNIRCLTNSPCGSLSFLTETSSGIEPVFEILYRRKKKINDGDQGARIDEVDQHGDKWQYFDISHPKLKLWMQVSGKDKIEESPWYGCCAHDLDYKKRISVQSLAQKHIDASISSTINFPESATPDDISNTYYEAWKSDLKGITIYREGSKEGVLTSKEQPSQKTKVIKRPKSLPCDVHHPVVRGKQYFVLVGLLDGNPYEVFADKNGVISKSINKGEVIKVKRGQYKAIFDNGFELDNLTENLDDLEDTITRLVSSNLRHGTDIKFLVQQLEKSKGDILSFEKAIARALKKYIKDGTVVTGEACESCKGDNLVRNSGCVTCMDCGWSKCL